MKKKILVIIIILSLPLIWYKVPQHKHKTLDGVLFQLETENEQNVQPVQIEIEGVFQRHFFRPMTFEGTIRINDELLPFPDSVDKKLKIKLGDPMKDEGLIRFWRTSYYGVPYYYGYLAVNHNVSKVAILKFNHNEQGTSWSSKDGMMISAPATNRAEALDIANELVGADIKEPRPLK